MERQDYSKVIFDRIRICGRMCWFNGMRINRSTVPTEKHQYEVAGDDECCCEPVRVKKGILVNFFGTVISDEPLPIGEDGNLWLEEGDFVWV